MSDLLKKMITDPTGAATAGAGAILPGSLGIAAGPVQAFIAAASVVTGTTIAAVKSLIKESDAIAEAKKAQFYFLYGADARPRSGSVDGQCADRTAHLSGDR